MRTDWGDFLVTITALQAEARLHHLAITSDNPKRLVEFYADTMDMTSHQVSTSEWRCEGPERRMIFMPGDNKSFGFCRSRLP